MTSTKTKNLVITIDAEKKNEWQIKAMGAQWGDWLKKNSDLFDNVIILPSKGESKLYWLEGDVEDPKDLEEIEKMKDQFKPILGIDLAKK